MSADLATFNKDTGVSTWVEATGDGSLITHTRQDTSSITDLNKEMQNSGRQGFVVDPDMWRVASIPHVVVIKWLNDHGVNFYNNEHFPAVKKLLNSSEYAWLRTGGGKL